jgi:hypothetical protein
MESYSKLIQRLLGNGSPKEQYENLEKIIELLENIAYPKRGSNEEMWDTEDIAAMSSLILEKLKPK